MLFALACLALACSPQERTPSASAPEQEASPLLTDADVRIAEGVDTVSTEGRDAVACLRRFFTQKLRHGAVNDYWYVPDTVQYGPPYAEILYAEYDSVGDLRYPPTVTAMRALPDDEGRLVSVVWSDGASAVATGDPKCAFDFLVRPTDEGARLAFPIAYNTRSWERHQVGPISYVISPRRAFNVQKAAEQERMLGELSGFFGIPVFPITYYSFADPADLYAAKGFRYHPLMRTLNTGGMVDLGDHVYSGNNSELYLHEVVHLFSHRRSPQGVYLLEEGLATLIGGSAELPYAEHCANLGRYLASDPASDLADRCNTHVKDEIYGVTSVPYTVGAVLCERILRRAGKEGLFRAMASGLDPWPVLEEYGVTRENLADEVRKELALPRIDVFASAPQR